MTSVVHNTGKEMRVSCITKNLKCR